jgi:uncharacterized protein (DUF885 family)
LRNNRRRLYALCAALSLGLLVTSLASAQSRGQVALESVRVGTVDHPRQDLRDSVESRYKSLVDAYFDYLLSVSPSWATQVGFHQYDCDLEDWSEAALAVHKEKLKYFKAAFSDQSFTDPRFLALGDRLDCRMVVANINGALFDLDEMQSIKRDPDRYSSHVADSVFGLAKRDFAPINERFVSAIKRMEKAPAFLSVAKQNLDVKLVPKMFAEVALEQLPGTIDLFESTIPEAFASADPALKERFRKAQIKLIEALIDYQRFVKEEILPKASGQFAIGAERYAKKLRYNEMEEAPLCVLLPRGYSELHRLQKRFKDLAGQINAKVSVEECFASISSDHPPSEKLVPATAAVLDRLAEFIEKKEILTIPSSDRVTVAESPSFLRALTFASMDTPGPYESKAKEAFYYVTPAEKTWSKERTEEHMRSFSYPDLVNTSVHEAYPGHYVQFLWVKKAPSKVRKLLGCSSNDEGWAHYCEEMMVEAGLPAKDSQYYRENPASNNPVGLAMDQKKLAMVQVHDALLRVCRYIVGIEMHTNGWSYEQGRDFFIKEGFIEKANAEREAKRGTSDPTYLVYTLGKLEILRLRADYQAKMGAAYSLKEFHDRFLKCGFPPLPIVRAELLNDEPTETK